MITQKTAADIWQCYRKIEAGEKLLQNMEERRKKYPFDKHEQHLKDAFGRGQSLELGIPCGENGHRLFGVSFSLAGAVIKSHIAAKRAELTEFNERARIEIDFTKTKISIKASINSSDLTEGSG